MIKFKKVVAETFRSWPILVIDFELGLNVLRGASGSGKSSILEAMYWGISGLSTKGEKTKDVVMAGKKDCTVLIDFEVGEDTYSIRRTTKSLEFKKNEIAFEGIHKEDHQREIYKVFGCTKETLIHNFIFGQGINTFSSLPAKGKRELMEQFFDTKWINSMKIENTMILRQLESDRTTLDREILVLGNELEVLEVNISSEVDKKNNFKEVQEEKLRQFNAHKLTLIKRSEVLPKLKTLFKVPDFDINKYNILKEELSDKYSERIVCESELKSLRLNLRNIKTRKHDLEIIELKTQCEHCLQSLDITQAEVEREKAIESVIAAYEECENQIRLKERKITDLGITINSMLRPLDKQEEAKKNRAEFLYKNDAIKRENQRNSELAVTYAKDMEKLVEAISETKKQKFDNYPLNQFKKKQTETKKLLKIKEKNYKEVNNQIEKYLWWGKALGATGISSYIFHEMISSFSVKVKSFIQKFGYDVDFSVDLSTSTPKFKINTLIEGVERPFSSRSGGEKKVIDLCIYFAMKSLLPSRFNILFVDEPMVGTDPKQREIIYSILREVSQELGVYIVTHLELDVYGGLNIIEMKNLK